ncbi:Formylglycine-generating enzyme, required for sulfatase activity, contains SUMF1/FGE domain [Anaerosporobacter mobilis DSM 15930]|jgi:formylglycine-generating enzyme required for sulfatase activity|uniref:Formylglycine-generating enzyme, required for sulfatase activity, contains SUMF1/FGE domain n=1 Tax=Anaerosporobacter mobilis DSM 15930 TaxID=1120996 RepID=A0A1M7GKZ2_9FIRM|nr:SUMF1/EgtB/PvdO family nonheme iron enzyme [Anaerosporobacter mobilis]SHM16930.1 Formylglycine-generating enzyme, required for sulfatase activity, contains SUMF1/FGE domain [Anaerosporobacter mobilis DSM 15930]
MKKLLVSLLLSIVVFICACSNDKADRFMLVEGGTYINTESDYYKDGISITDFYIGKYEVTQQEWIDVMGSNPSNFTGNNLPVDTVSWYDCIEYCNKRSEKEGLEPYYNIDKNLKDPDNINEVDNIKWIVTMNEEANGYRLPTQAEWEYAASGGQLSKNNRYSGDNNADEVAWYWRNAGDTYLSGDWTWAAIENNNNNTKPVGEKKPNELGIYDMSGNVREWCWDWFQDDVYDSGYFRVCKGGGWIGDVICCEISYSGKFDPNGIGSDQGFRVCRNK